jgi:Fe-S cluster assembly protein SufD
MMSESVAFYQNQALGVVSSNPWLLDLQQQALKQFNQLGFPTRHDEDWKYTSVESFLQHRFVSPKAISITTSTINDLEISLERHQLLILDGILQATNSLPMGIVVLPILDALAQMPERVKPYLGRILKSEHAFHALNIAMLRYGLFIYIPENVQVEKPIWITHWQTQANQAIHLRHLIVAEQGSQASIVEEYRGDTAQCYHTNCMTEVYLASHAQLTHYKIQRESRLAYHVGHLASKQASHSQLDCHLMSLGGQWVRNDLTLNLDEPNARCLMNGMYLPFDGQHMDQHTLVNHAAPHCQSAQDYKGIVNGHARAVFNGRIVVAKDAQQTEAKQQNKNLLLSMNAEVDTKPQLEIYADDVVCTHGATVGQLDDESLFYLATRGIGREEASRFLMQAFMTENLRAIANPALREWMSEIFNQQIGWLHDEGK